MARLHAVLHGDRRRLPDANSTGPVDERAADHRPAEQRTFFRAGPTPRSAPAAGPAPGGRSTPEQLLQLQRSAGNAAVARLLGPAPTVQRAPGDADVGKHGMTDAERPGLVAADTAPGLLAEDKALYAKRDALKKALKDKKAAAKKRGETYTGEPGEGELEPAEQQRLTELDKQLNLRFRGDEEDTLAANGVSGTVNEWFAKVTPTTFLGKAITVHELLATRLTKAEDALRAQPAPAGGWLSEMPSSLRPPNQGLHSFGMAIDINPGTNPYLLNPAKTGGKADRAISDIVNRAVLLVTARTAAEADLQSRPTEADKDKRVDASYAKLSQASDALELYQKLDQPDRLAELAELVRTLGAKSTLTAAQWITQIGKDRPALAKLATPKSWQKPETGFLNLDQRLVKAMTDSAGAGLTWLGDDTVGSGRDIMHFDMRGPGPIRIIVKSHTHERTNMGRG